MNAALRTTSGSNLGFRHDPKDTPPQEEGPIGGDGGNGNGGDAVHYIFMFGLGIGELVLLIAVVALIGGPAAVMKLGRLAKGAQRAKSELTGKAMLGRILDPGEPRRTKPKRKKRKKRPS